MKKSLKHRRYLMIFAAVLTTALICTAFAGCGDLAALESGRGPASASETATPTLPPKEGLDAVFGKEQITIEAISNGSEEESALFFEGAQAEAKSLGVTLNASAAGDGFDSAFSSKAGTADAVIACLVKEQSSNTAIDAAAGNKPAVVFEMKKGSVAGNVSHIYYTPDTETQLAFDAALTYPPHDTPVRLILMFESMETESYKMYAQLYGEGKIFPKEVFIASEQKTTAGEWLTAKLKNYIAGMLDGVYAENSTLALNALDSIEALSRTDMEVFCPGVTSATIERMQKNPDVFAQSVGPDTYLAGVLSVRAALKQLKGDSSVTLEMQPIVVKASDLAENSVQALADLYGETASKWNEGWMDALRAYYGTTK